MSVPEQQQPTVAVEPLLAKATDVHYFEGPEKILEVDFIPEFPTDTANAYPRGLREIQRSVWDTILSQAKCEILSSVSNDHFDAYVLSESSLFVYDRNVYIKTCGTTTLLRCLNLLISTAQTVGLVLEWVGYSRKDYLFPNEQAFPHTSFDQEVSYAKEVVYGPKGEKLNGGAFVLGDLTADHWFVYVADKCERPSPFSLDRNVNIMMYDLHPSVSKVFYKDQNCKDVKLDALRARNESGLSNIIKDGLFDDHIFEPCGYSLNVLKGEAFFTVHITPEDQCCYASFETNVETLSYESMLKDVLKVFKPKRFTVTVFADKCGLAKVERSPVDFKLIHLKGEKDGAKFVRESRSSTCFATDYVCQLANFNLVDHHVELSTNSIDVDETASDDLDAHSDGSC